MTEPVAATLVAEAIHAFAPPIALRNASPNTEVSAAVMCSCSPLVPARPALP
jgi:hypothetical protein